MATSGTTSFNLSIEEMIEEAYQRCGLAVNSGYDLKRARVLCNLIFSEWGNRGVHLWKVELKVQALSFKIIYFSFSYISKIYTTHYLIAYFFRCTSLLIL